MKILKNITIYILLFFFIVILFNFLFSNTLLPGSVIQMKFKKKEEKKITEVEGGQFLFFLFIKNKNPIFCLSVIIF